MKLLAATLALVALAPLARAQTVVPDDGPAPAQPSAPAQPAPPYPPPAYPPQAVPQQQAYPQQQQQYVLPPGYQLVPIPPPLTEDQIRELEQRGTRNVALGAVLIALGAALDITALAFIIDYYGYYGTPRLAGDTSHNWEPYASLGIGIGANVMLGVGVPFLTSGLRDKRAAKHARTPPPRLSWNTF